MNAKSDNTVSSPGQLSLLELHVNAARHQVLQNPTSSTAARPTSSRASRGISREKLLHVLDEALAILDDDEGLFDSGTFASRRSRNVGSGGRSASAQ